MRNAILILEDGACFKGKAIGMIGITYGEIAFNTGMTGYQEIFTDPSYFGQIIVMTTNYIGNYGNNEIDVESDKINISGLVCKNFSTTFSRSGNVFSLQDYLIKNNKCGISNIDTRKLVKHIRDKGAMNAIISSDMLDINKLKKQFYNIPNMNGLELASKVSTKESYILNSKNAKYKIAVLDFGIKKNILNSLIQRDCELKIFPNKTSTEEIESWHPDGYVLSNGPGDPYSMKEEINKVKFFLNLKKPVFGICLGHQIMALANGLSTVKMYNGHRGINHPVKNLLTDKCEITSQNHGFVVSRESINSNVEVTHIHLNDNTIMGLKYNNFPAFSVQFHPEASPGPNDSKYLFDEFIKLIKKYKNECN